MKKLVLLSLIGILLTGCGEDKITKEYLVGDWRCKMEVYGGHRIGNEKSHEELMETKEYSLSYNLINGELNMVVDGLYAGGYDLDKILNNPGFNEVKNGERMKSGGFFDKKDNDNYSYTFRIEHTKPSKNAIIFVENVDTCTRIK